MNQNLPGTKSSLTNPKLWAIFFLYIITAGYAIAHHELWGDEIHSWNIAKASGSFFDLLTNTRYEGHPPVWYFILWTISKFTYNTDYIQVVQFLMACSFVFLVLFYSPFPFITKLLIPFGYFFIFEYAVLSRNYAIGIFLAFCICIIIRRDFKSKLLLYYALLFFMSNTHLLALLLAGSLHLYFLLLNIEQKKGSLLLHIVLGVLIFLPSVYFIFPPSDSGLNASFLLSTGEIHQLSIVSKSPLRAFFPIPAWWNYNFWNTQFMLDLQNKSLVLKVVSLLMSAIFAGMAMFLLKNNKKSLAVFIVNLVLTFLIAFIFPLTAMRYTGFIYVGFISAYWLYCYETPTGRISNWLIILLLSIQLIAGVFAIAKDIRFPFSNAPRINEILNKIPANEKVVTDIGCVNNVSAFTGKAMYCIGPDREVSFVQWNNEFKLTTPNPYFNSITKLFQKEGLKKVYLISIYTPQTLSQFDSRLENSFQLKLIDKREGAIEKWSNLYLYQVSALP